MFDQLVKAPPILPDNIIFITILAVLYGIVQAYAIIEAQTVALAPIIVLTLGGIWIWLWRKSKLG